MKYWELGNQKCYKDGTVATTTSASIIFYSSDVWLGYQLQSGSPYLTSTCIQKKLATKNIFLSPFC